MAKYVTITNFGLQTGSDNTLYAKWTWGSASTTDHYLIRWYYATGDGIPFLGSESQVGQWDVYLTTYNIPSNAYKVMLYIKPYAKTHKVNDKDVVYWTADWTPVREYLVSNSPPAVPPVPTVTIEDLKLNAVVDISQEVDRRAKQIEFQVIKDNYYLVNTSKIKINVYHAELTLTVEAGHEYKVRCRAVRDKVTSNWTEYSSNVDTPPAAPSGITKCRTETETSIYLKWAASTTATGYDVEYTTNKKYFGASNQTTTQSVSGSSSTQYYFEGLETGKEYFFRVRAKNSHGESDWTAIKSCILGEKPSAPTTWSSTTTGMVGETVKLYWLHNTKDGSKPTYYKLEIKIDGVAIAGSGTAVADTRTESEKDNAFEYSLNLTGHSAGSVITWRVRTAGITNEYSDWSAERTITVYSQPSLALTVTNANNTSLSTITSFPFYIRGTASPTNETHKPIGYHLSIISNDTYETEDYIGNTKIVKSGDVIYSKYFDARTQSGWVRSADGGWLEASITRVSETLLVYMDANNIDLENNKEYTVKCIVSMNSGLTAASTATIDVSWSETDYEPDAEIGIDENSVAAYIRPFCKRYASNWGTEVPELDSVHKYLWNYKEFVLNDGTVLHTTTPTCIHTYNDSDAVGSVEFYYKRSSSSSAPAEDANNVWTTSLPGLCASSSLKLWNYAKIYGENGSILTTTTKSIVCNYTAFGSCPTTLNWTVIDRYVASDSQSVTPRVSDSFVNGVKLSVYRREYDGSFTTIQTGVNNGNGIYVIDPHPSLNYARYRIVATDISTGAVSFYDLPPYPVDEGAVIIQWDEQWSPFEVEDNNILAEQPMTGSLLRLPYNVDVSESNAPDVETIEYIGRESPVSYYGTQLGESMSINADIDSTDHETIYALRRLSKWMGDVYVREPSGIGYWANVTVSMSKKHCDLTIPVTISATRVEGGV